MEYYLVLHGLLAGPYGEEQIEDAIRLGALPPSTKSRLAQSLDWVPLDQHPRFFAAAAAARGSSRAALLWIYIRRFSVRILSSLTSRTASVAGPVAIGVLVALSHIIYNRNADSSTRAFVKNLGFSETLAELSAESVTVFATVIVSLYASVAARFVFHQLAPPEPSLGISTTAPWREVFINSVKRCEALAQAHAKKSSVFLLCGLIVATFGIGMYAYESIVAQHTTYYESQLKTLSDNVSSLAGKMIFVGGTINESMISKNMVIVTPDSKNDAAQVCRDSLNSMREASLQCEMGLPRIESTVKDAMTAYEADRGAFKWYRDLLPAIHHALAFVFVEVIAGLFFAISRRNELQAAAWRSQIQVYERLISIPAMLAEMDYLKDNEKLHELLHKMLTPVATGIVESGKDDNVSLEAIKTIIEAARVVPKKSDLRFPHPSTSVALVSTAPTALALCLSPTPHLASPLAHSDN